MVILFMSLLGYGQERSNKKAAQEPKRKVFVEKVGMVRVINPSPVVMQESDTVKEVQKVADLVIGDIHVEPNPGAKNQTIRFLITVKNISPFREKHAKSCYLKLVFSFMETGSFPPGYYTSDPYFFVIPKISSGCRVQLELSFKFQKTARWMLRAYADGKNTIPEIREDNNCIRRYFQIMY
jgi:hypothetical protein